MDIRQELLQNNPFASVAAANPWNNSAPDIISLNGDVHEQIFHLIQNKTLSPETPLAGLIIGEVGSGKTHMLKRILARIIKDDVNAIFVNARAFSVHETVMQDMWREIFANLRNQRDEKTSQFNFIAARMMNIYRRHNALNGSSKFGGADGIGFFQNRLPGIHPDFLKAIFAYFDHTSEERRQAALRWFSGDSDEDQPALLGVKNRIPMSPAALEGEAEQMILSLGLILQFCGVSMAVCFDQLDAMQDKVLINAWGKVAAFLVNNAVSILPLAFLQISTWMDFFSQTLSPQVLQRFTNKYILKNCTLEQEIELVCLRIKAFFGEASDDICKWVLEQLHGKLKPGYSPRIVLDLANRAILNYGSPAPVQGEKMEPDGVIRALDKEYREECDKIAANFVMWQSDAKRLQNALEIYLNHDSNFTAIGRPDDKYISLTARRVSGSAPERDCSFIISTTRHHKTAGAALKRGADFLRDNPGKICYYITDIFFPDSWKAVRAELDGFEQLGGIALFLTQEQAVSWYGLGELNVKIRSGDVTFLSSGGEVRTAGMDDFKLYLEQGFKTKFLEAEQPEKKNREAQFLNSVQPLNEDELVKNISELLRNSPMRSMKVEMLLDHLTDEVPITRARLLEFLGGQNGKFSLLPTGDSTIVMLKLQ